MAAVTDSAAESAASVCVEAKYDADGYPLTARRRLKRLSDEVVVDVDDGQQFRPRKIKGGFTRLVPIFKRRVDWKSSEGYAAMRLLLSCMGAEGEYELWDAPAGRVMDVQTWTRQRYGNEDQPPIWHRVCGETVTSTNITSLQQGRNIGCTCHSTSANHWRGRRAEVVEWGVQRGFEVVTTESEWIQWCVGIHWRPTLRCLKCGETVTGTQINQLQKGSNAGCGCHLSILQHWRDRRAEVIEWGVKRGFEVITTEAEWVQWCAGIQWCPTLRCFNCGVVVKSATLNNLHQGHHIGCTCHSSHANHWRGRRAEVVQWGAERDFDVVTTDEEWVQWCAGIYWCPTLRCLKCKTTVTNTNINNLQHGQGIGCACRNKTEAKLQEWLTRSRSFPNAAVVPQSPGPKTDLNGQTHFDFLLRFSDEHAVYIELDGAQHFWKDAFRYNERRCGLDKLKEEWAVTERGRCVVRVLQDDVWCDKYDWQGWIVRSVASSRHGAPRVFTPSVPEYTSDASVYAHVLP